MRSRRRPFVPIASVLLAALLMLTTACSSSGGSVSQSTLAAKLKKDPAFKTISAKLDPSRTDVVAQCTAKALEKDADQGDLKQYVDGKLALQEVGSKSKKATSLGADIQLCLKNATG